MNTTVLVCVKERFGNAPSCHREGMIEMLAKKLADQGLAVPVKPLVCFGRCDDGPNVRIAPGGAFFTRMTLERLDEVVDAVRQVVLASGLEG